jgi:hypothetical protein
MKCRDGCTDFIDDADTLVAQDAAGRASRNVAFEDMQVSTADRRLHDLDDRIRWFVDLRFWTIFECFLSRSMLYESLHAGFLL